MRRPSDAIRIGALLRPQVYDALFRQLGLTDTFGSCALGAAYEADGNKVALVVCGSECACNCVQVCDKDGTPLPSMTNAYLGLNESFPILKRSVELPCECMWSWSLMHAIQHMNDDHHWTRERIADWVETVENAQAAEAGNANCTRGEGNLHASQERVESPELVTA